LLGFHLSLGQHATHFDGEIEAMNTALIQPFGRAGRFEKAVVFSDSISVTESIAKSDALPSKRVTEIHSPIKLMKGIQKDIKFQWILSHYGAVCNKIADYLAKKGTKISQTSACKLTFQSPILRIKSIQAEYYAIQSQHKSWDKTVRNSNIIPDFPRDAVMTFQLITGHDC
jgi:ribonuclease HI